VVAEVDLEAVEPATAGGKGFDFDAGIAQWLHVTVRQGMAADAVVQQINRHAFGGFLQQQGLQALPEAIVVDDEKLNQYRFLRVADGFKYGVEGGLAIDQQTHFVVRQARHPSQFRHGPQGRVGT